MDIPGGEPALEAFEEFLQLWQHQGMWRFEKELRRFVEQWSWAELFAPTDKFLFARRALAIHRVHNAVAYSQHRFAQLCDGGFDWIIYKCRDAGQSYSCGELHGDLDGLVFAPDDPVLQRYLPPTTWNCSCALAGASKLPGSMRRTGGDPSKPVPAWAKEVDPETGLPQRIDAYFARAGGPDLAEIILAIGRGEADLF